MAEMTRRAEQIERLLERRDELYLSNAEWAALTKRVDREGVHYQSIRRLEHGAGIPRPRTLRVLEDALNLAQKERRERLATAS